MSNFIKSSNLDLYSWTCTHSYRRSPPSPPPSARPSVKCMKPVYNLVVLWTVRFFNFSGDHFRRRNLWPSCHWLQCGTKSYLRQVNWNKERNTVTARKHSCFNVLTPLPKIGVKVVLPEADLFTYVFESRTRQLTLGCAESRNVNMTSGQAAWQLLVTIKQAASRRRVQLSNLQHRPGRNITISWDTLKVR